MLALLNFHLQEQDVFFVNFGAEYIFQENLQVELDNLSGSTFNKPQLEYMVCILHGHK